MGKFFNFLSQHWQKERGKIALIFLFVVLSQSLSLIEPFLFAKILDDFLRHADNPSFFSSPEDFFYQLAIIVGIWIASAFGARIFKNFQQYFVGTVSDRIGIRIFERALKHVLNLPLNYHANHKTGEVFRRLSKARDDITELFTIFFDKIFQNSFSIAIVVIYVFYAEWRIGLALVGFVPLFFLVTWFFTKKIKTTQNEINSVNEKIYGTSFQAINNIEVVKAFATEEHELNIAKHDNKLSHKNLKIKTLAFQYLGFAQGTVVNLARVVLLWYGTILAFQGVLTFGEVVLFTFYSFVIYQPLYEIGTIYSKYHEGVNAVDRLQEVLSQPMTIKSPDDGVQPKKLTGKIEFKNVSFAYNDDRPILNNVSFTIEPGKKLAVVGLSGNGKSTIIKLLLRFYDVTKGQILIDDKDIKDYDLPSLRRRIGLVLQDNILFHTSLKENIKYGTPKAKPAEVEAASNKAQLNDLLKKLPKGLDTKVGERGVMLSGGEKQRVAIARSVIKKPDIFIFDEATSSLDSRSEELIKEAMADVSQNTTSITISHRFSTVIDADDIILLEDGKIKEQGSHEQLIKANKRYAELYELQTSDDQ